METILITGAAGFIGSNLSRVYLDKGYRVIGVDNLNDYYDPEIKLSRLAKLKSDNFNFVKADISNKDLLMHIFEEFEPKTVVNLAAQAGVRYSLINPDSYMASNMMGFYNILECCRFTGVEKLLYASSSSVYGSNVKVPFEETDIVDNPVSLYAATKKSNELLAEVYTHLYGFKAIGLRFFTVYGPAGRPDMAYFGFVDKFFNNEPIHIFNNGDFENDLYRDFTYIADIVTGIEELVGTETSKKHEVFNIGNNQPVKLMAFITTLEECLSNSLGRIVEFEKIYEPIKPGDVPATYASIDKLSSVTGFKPSTDLKKGLQEFTDWYVKYYNKA